MTTKDHATAKKYHPIYDANANIVQYVNAITALVAAGYEYDPFGDAIGGNQPQTPELPFKFSTKYHDHETNFSYYGFRYYNDLILISQFEMWVWIWRAVLLAQDYERRSCWGR